MDKDGAPWSGHWKPFVELFVNSVDFEFSINNLS